MRIVGAVATVVLVASLAACSADSGGALKTPRASSTAAQAGGRAPRESVAAAALLTPEKVGASFRRTPYPLRAAPMPCARTGAPELGKATSAVVRVGRRLDSTHLQVTIVEEVFAYRTVAAAKSALTVALQGFDCARGTLYRANGDAVPENIGAMRDVRAKVTTDAAYLWSLSTNAWLGAQTLILSKRAIVTMRITVTIAGARTGAKLPDPIELAKVAGNAAGKV